MPTTSRVKILSRIAFSLGLFFTTVCFVDTWRQPFFLNTHFKILKIALCVALPFLLTVFVYIAEKSYIFVAKACCVISVLFVVGYIVDRLWIGWIACFGEFLVIYHLAYALISMGTVLATCIFLKYLSKNSNDDFNLFYKTFFKGFSLLLFFVFVLIYFVLRQYNNDENSINFLIFNGEIKNVFTLRTSDLIVRFLGNILFYSALCLALIEIFKTKSVTIACVVAILLSVICEIFEYLTACGDMDIDDIITNTFGVLLGYAVYKLVIKKLLIVKE